MIAQEIGFSGPMLRMRELATGKLVADAKLDTAYRFFLMGPEERFLYTTNAKTTVIKMALDLTPRPGKRRTRAK